MGNYLNPTAINFKKSLNSLIYVDKTMLIKETNAHVNTQQCFMCISRPRRFGKTMALDMLSAYYSGGQDNHQLFDNLKIHNDNSYEEHINKYNVIKINIQEFLSSSKSVSNMLERLCKYISYEILDNFSKFNYYDKNDIAEIMKVVYANTNRQFIILIDEWDCLFREYKDDLESQKKYLDFLRMWLKDQPYIALVYMTGILPIKKYGTHSALNMFSEYSMIEPRKLAPYFGFTEDEVKELCAKYHMSFEEAKSWYDGYKLSTSTYSTDNVTYSIYSPRSIVESMHSGSFNSYWNQTETYEALRVYIELNIDGLKESVTKMLSGIPININIEGFTNDMTTFANKDDIFTLLIHLGYLSYHPLTKTVTIPNKEVSQVYVTSIERINSYSEVARAVDDSRNLLNALIDLDEQKVAKGIDQAHEEISILNYNDENSLSCCIHLAFYFAREYYTIIRELPSGKGFADVVFIPRKLFADKPAIVIELKYDKAVEGAIAQIKDKHYCNTLKDYQGNLLLVGINYNRSSKKHECLIEQTKW